MNYATSDTLRMIRRKAGLRGFFAHLGLFGAAIFIALLTGYDWSLFWPLVGWTVGVAIHGLMAVGPGQFLGGLREADRLQRLSGGSKG